MVFRTMSSVQVVSLLCLVLCFRRATFRVGILYVISRCKCHVGGVGPLWLHGRFFLAYISGAQKWLTGCVFIIGVKIFTGLGSQLLLADHGMIASLHASMLLMKWAPWWPILAVSEIF